MQCFYRMLTSISIEETADTEEEINLGFVFMGIIIKGTHSAHPTNPQNARLHIVAKEGTLVDFPNRQ